MNDIGSDVMSLVVALYAIKVRAKPGLHLVNICLNHM